MKFRNYKKELLNIFFAQKQIIVFTTVLILLGAIIAAFYLPPTYEAVGKILIKGKLSERNQQAIAEQLVRTSSMTKEVLSSEAEILMSDDVIEKTIWFLQKEGKYPPKYASIPNVKAEVDYIRRKIAINIIPVSNVIEIRYTDTDRVTAQDILAALMDQYIEHRMEVYYPVDTKDSVAKHPTSEYKQTDQFKSELEKNEDELEALIHTTHGVAPVAEIDKNLLTKNNLEQQLNGLSNDAIGKTLDIEQLEKAMTNNDFKPFSAISTNVAIAELNRSLLALFVERGSTLRQYHEESFKVKAIDKQVESTKNELKKEVDAFIKTQKNELEIINKKISNINNIIEKINLKNLALKKQMILTEKINSENELYKSTHSTFSKNKEESRSNSPDNVIGFFITILSKAFAPETPLFPQKNVILPLGLIFGIISGISLGFIREFLDHTFKNPSDVENYSGMQMIFSLVKLEDKVVKKTFSFPKSLIIIALIPILLIFLYAASTLYSSTYGIKTYPPISKESRKNVSDIQNKLPEPVPVKKDTNEISTGIIENVEHAITEKSESKLYISDKTVDSVMDNINVSKKKEDYKQTLSKPNHHVTVIVSEEILKEKTVPKPIVSSVETKKDVELQASLTPLVTKVEPRVELTTVETFKTLYSYYDNEKKINALQLYSFSDKENAEITINKLKGFGLNAYVKTIDIIDGRGTLNRILITPFCIDNSRIKENFNTHISDVTLMVDKSTGEFSLNSNRFNNIKNAILTVDDLKSMGWLSNVYGFDENGETHYRVALTKNCVENQK
jgi:uncharacterized protein involved in exopolysaccharide biosynthesis/cell division septation protein DedD